MKKYLALCTLIAALLLTVSASAQDVAGSEDHPLITRYPDSVITWYETQEFDPYKIAVGPVTGYRTIDEWVETEGRITRINYVLDGERSSHEVFSNYLSALKKGGFEILAEGSAKESKPSGEVGHRGFMQVHYAANPVPPGSSTLLSGSATSGGSGYVAAKLDRPEGAVYVAVGVAQYKEDQIVTLVDVIETRAMEDDLITVDAAYMAKEINNVGKVVLYGINFEHDKATIMEESMSVVAEIAKLLTNEADLKVYVVGHTDGSGALDYNLRLSKDRAAAVVDALVADHGIARDRLDPHGVGPLVPVASNAGDTGKAKNRRVELVER